MDFGDLKMYIGGKLLNSLNKSTKEITCPANESIIANIAWASSADSKLALDAAQAGFKRWSSMTLEQRSNWIVKLRDAVLKNEEILRTAIMFEMGKTYDSTYEDIEALVNSLNFYPKAMKTHFETINIVDLENTHTHSMVYSPVGVAVAYLAWNFPLLNIAFKIGPSLASGCSIIIKPSECSPVSAYLLGKILYEINFPPGVVNILCGDPKEVASTLTKSTIPRLVTMIGSTNTGKRVTADSSSSIKRLSMELGGNAPFIVFDDADFEAALDLAIGIKFGNSGQICVAANRFFIHKDIFDSFLKAYVERVRKIKLGFGKKAKVDMGPVINFESRERIMNLIKDAVNNGANIEIGGNIPEKFTKGYWLEPTVLSNVNSKMKIYNEEIFGPVACIMSFDDDKEVLNLANDTNYGLASYLFTKSEERIKYFSKNLDFGEVQVNGIKYAIYLPHGGVKDSGVGHDCSHYALEDYLSKKRVSIAL
ncbi:MAG: NAD-dependent succinate-semialdehyde dehydrogenase [Flavobacteriaceae bacterium]|nr:NAD-dependent succinate-semialdehyde dehydrogenase [Flavobacteriaceae bacterium]